MYKINTEIICSSKLDEETLLVNLDTGFYYTLDEVGGVIWEKLLAQEAKAKIVAGIAGAYAVDPAQVENDFDELIALLETENLIQITPEEIPR